jgi:hypothetical protein
VGEPGRVQSAAKIQEENMSEVNIEQVNLLLKLYDMRREPKLREARDWFMKNFHPQTVEDVMKIAPPGSEENAYMRQVLTYWEMVASIANRGLIEQEFFFENTGEQWGVFEQIKPVLASWRQMFSSPKFLANLEENVTKLEAWRERRNPGSNAAIRRVMQQMRAAMQEQKTQAAAAD